MDNESYFFVFWHMQLYMSWYIRSFFSFTFLNILYFFKYSCTSIFHRRSLYTFYSDTVSTSVQMHHGPLARYVKFRVTHAPGMPGTFSAHPRVGDPDMHHGTCVTHVPRCMLGSLTSGFLWSQWLGKRSRYSRCMRNPQLYVSGNRPMARVKSLDETVY